MKKIQYVVGLQFGDEGKGLTVQHLCKEALNRGEKPIVMRYCSGPQAGHTVFYNNICHTFSSFGSGTLLDIPTYLYPLTNCLIDPIALKAEYDVLVSKGITPKFKLSKSCTVITPYHVIVNRNNEEALQNGTCGCGIWWALEDEFDFTDDPIYILNSVKRIYKLKTQEKLENAFIEAWDFLKSHFCSLDQLEEYDTYIFESCQGLALDQERGFKPYVTPCEIFPHDDSLYEPLEGLFEQYKPEVFLVTRTYTTRHGSGYNPVQKCIDFLNLEVFESNKDNQFQGKFRTGILDFDLINKCIQRHCLDNYEVNYNLVITHCDCLNKFGDQYCIPFVYNGINNNLTKTNNIGKFIAKQIDLEFQDIYESWDYKSNLVKVWLH